MATSDSDGTNNLLPLQDAAVWSAVAYGALSLAYLLVLAPAIEAASAVAGFDPANENNSYLGAGDLWPDKHFAAASQRSEAKYSQVKHPFDYNFRFSRCLPSVVLGTGATGWSAKLPLRWLRWPTGSSSSSETSRRS